jgi:hypothetical protein
MDHRGPHDRHLQAVGGVDHAVDQVKRRIAFDEANPGWQIWPGNDGNWHAERERPGGPDTVVMGTLKALLDALGAPQGGPE